MRAQHPLSERAAIVRGSGVAALTCARLLALLGWRVRLHSDAAQRPLHLMLSEPTAMLLGKLWNDPSLLAGAHPINARAVCWGAAPECRTLPARGVAIAAGELVQRLRVRLDMPEDTGDIDGEGGWIVDARPCRHEDDASVYAFGRRRAAIAQAQLRKNSGDDVCMMESLACGWAFLLPIGDGQAALQFVSIAETDALPRSTDVVAGTRLIRRAIASVGPWTGSVPSMPRMRQAPARHGHIAIGEGALAFDPISGDGVGHALRGVVFAVTQLEAIANGEKVQKCLDDYAGTLRRAMAQHLSICLRFYADAPNIPECREEIREMETGLALLRDPQIHHRGAEAAEKMGWPRERAPEASSVSRW